MGDLKMIQDENSVLTDDELVIVRDFLRTSKHACFIYICMYMYICLYIRNEHPRKFRVMSHVLGDHFFN